MSIIIEEVTEKNKHQLEDYVLSRNDTTFVDRWEWRKIGEKIYNFTHYWYVAKDDGKVSGFLGLTFVQHPIFGKYLSTAAYANQGGFYYDSSASADALICKAIAIQAGIGAAYTVIRHLEGEKQPPKDWYQDSSHASYRLELTKDPDVLFRKILRKEKIRSIKKSNKFGFKVKFGGVELIDDFWQVISISMKQLGSPYHSIEYVRSILESKQLASELVVVYTKDGLPAATSLLVYHQNHVTQYHANSLNEYRQMSVGDHLYWSVISECCRRNYKYLDMGRSLIGSGNEIYKLRWGSTKITLAYWYHLAPGQQLPQLKQNNPKYQMAIRIWQRMPLSLIRFIPTKIISGIV